MTFAIIGYGTVGQATQDAGQYHGHKCMSIVDPRLTEDWHTEHLQECDFAFICVDTPSAEDGSCDTSNVEAAVRDLMGRGYEGTIVVRSTVPPGFLEHLACANWPALTQRLLHNPEFLRMRDAESTSRWPDFVVIGCTPARGGAQWVTNPAARRLRDFYLPYFEDRTGAPIFCVDWNTAAMVKYASNALIALTIIGAEQLYDVAESVGADWHQVYSILQHCRVTPKTIRVDPEDRGFGGACLPTDLDALIHLTGEVASADYGPRLFDAARVANEVLRHAKARKPAG